MALAVLGACGSLEQGAPAQADWPIYGGSSAGDRYSELTQIDKSNVGQLREAWRFETGAGGLQTSPLMIGGVLYAATPDQKTIALHAATGRPVWEFAPEEAAEQPIRGLTWWQAGGERRLFTSSGTHLVALDPATGKPLQGFGAGGKVDLREGLGRDPATLTAYLTTPGVIFGDTIIVGFRTSETHPAAPGAARAYDVRTGKLRWTFNLIPKPGEKGHETWPADAWRTAGGANSWPGMVVDQARGILFVPTGSAVNDFYGGDRPGDNLYSDSLVALDARTGSYLWHFQGVHHDIWDRDFPSPPVLVKVRHGGRMVDAVAQPSKQGFLFLFDRVTGKPLFPVEERPVPPSDVPGEVTAPTQPYALKPAPFARQAITGDMLTNRTPAARAFAEKAFAEMRSGHMFLPFAVGKPTLVIPGFDGGAEWGGPAVDRKRNIIYINSNDVAWIGELSDTQAGEPGAAGGRGAAVYGEQCSGCHGENREGAPPDFPPLTDVGERLSAEQIARIIVVGKGRMPGFPHIAPDDRAALVGYLKGERQAEDRKEAASAAPALAARYRFTGYRKFLDPDGYPAVAPPWGTLNAIDLDTGEYLWRRPFGEYPELVAQGMKETGSENYGGPIVTASGLLFIGATIYDRKFRAFDSLSGRLLWETVLPYSGVATPITYMLGGRQYVVIATSGQRDPKGPKGSAYVAFALPN